MVAKFPVELNLIEVVSWWLFYRHLLTQSTSVITKLELGKGFIFCLFEKLLGFFSEGLDNRALANSTVSHSFEEEPLPC